MTGRNASPPPQASPPEAPHARDQHPITERLATARRRIDVALTKLEGIDPAAASTGPAPRAASTADIDAAIDVVDAAIAMVRRGAGSDPATAARANGAGSGDHG